MSNSNAGIFYLPSNGFCIHIKGSDAAKVLNNLCTNEVANLSVGDTTEAFVTNDKGWAIAYGLIHRQAEDLVLLTGQHPSPSLVCEHIDRYIIMEDAEVSDATSGHAFFVAPADVALSSDPLQLPLPFAQPHMWVICKKDTTPFSSDAPRRDDDSEVQAASEEQYEALRILNFWPIMGREIRDKSIPQELDRDEHAISFTKGCYLGQETIARLDARGQVQKKLCLLQIDGTECPELGAELFKPPAKEGDEPKSAGTISSAAMGPDNQIVALATLKRHSYEKGTALDCCGMKATVLSRP